MEITVALVAGVTGALVAGLFQIRGRRLDQLRERQIAAADEFAAAAANVFVTLTKQMGDLAPVEAQRERMDAFRSAAETAWANVNDLTRRGPRVGLLFGESSPTEAAAREVVTHFRLMTVALRNQPAEEADLVAERLRLDEFLDEEAAGGGPEATQQFFQADQALGRFIDSASHVVTWPLWRQHLGWRQDQPEEPSPTEIGRPPTASLP
jgi:hypothetical protein